MFKNSLRLFVVAIPLLILGAGCASQPTSIQTNDPIDNASSSASTSTDPNTDVPVIVSLSKNSGPVGTELEIKGSKFAGFEGDKNAWIKNSAGEKGILYGETGSTDSLIKVTLKSPLCQNDTSYSGAPCNAWLMLIPGTYKIYTSPWAKDSNEVLFTIK